MRLMLEAAGIETFYGASQALFGVDLQVGEGQMVALLGRNGMGKTTTIRSLFGLTPARPGSTRFPHTQIPGLPASRIARPGISHGAGGRHRLSTTQARRPPVTSAHPGAPG